MPAAVPAVPVADAAVAVDVAGVSSESEVVRLVFLFFRSALPMLDFLCATRGVGIFSPARGCESPKPGVTC